MSRDGSIPVSGEGQPDLSFEQIAKAITRQRHILLSADQVEELFDLHGLKKTMQTAVPRH